MKIKHLIIVSLTLIILTIGAVSASENSDNLTAISQDISIDNDNILSDQSEIDIEDGDEFEIGNEDENLIEVDIDSEDDVEGTLLVK